MSRSVLVVNPYVTDFKLYDEWMHPSGLYMLIDLLESNNVPVIYFNCLERADGNVVKKYGTGTFKSQEITRPSSLCGIKRKYKRYGCTEETFRAFCASVPEISAIFVGSMMTYWVDGVVQTVGILQEEFPGKPIVAGGIAVQLIPEYLSKRLPGVTLYPTALPEPGKGVTFPGIEQTLYAPSEYSVKSAVRHVKDASHGMILTTLGCPMRCSYCASSRLQKSFIRRSQALICAEVEEMYTQWSVKDFSFYDDALLVDAENGFIPLMRLILREGFTIRFHTPNGLHLKYCSEELLYIMKQAGFTTLRFGYESGLVRNRSLTGGKADETLLKTMLISVQKHHFTDTGVYIMGGLPGSSPDEMAEEMQLIAGFGVKVKPVFLSPVPGTKLFEYYREMFPSLENDPHWHNDTFFILQVPGWGESAVEQIRTLARTLNGALLYGV